MWYPKFGALECAPLLTQLDRMDRMYDSWTMNNPLLCNIFAQLPCHTPIKIFKILGWNFECDRPN